MRHRHVAALALVGCLALASCTAGMTADDPCRREAISPVFAALCEHNRASSTQNALLDDYRKCVDLNASDPTKCSAILQALNTHPQNVPATPTITFGGAGGGYNATQQQWQADRQWQAQQQQLFEQQLQTQELQQLNHTLAFPPVQ